jgi:hypothetical protein
MPFISDKLPETLHQVTSKTYSSVLVWIGINNVPIINKMAMDQLKINFKILEYNNNQSSIGIVNKLHVKTQTIHETNQFFLEG